MDELDIPEPSPSSSYAPLTVGVIVVCSVFPALAAVSVLVRFWCRKAYNIPLKADDWVIIPALVLTLATCGCGLWGRCPVGRTGGTNCSRSGIGAVEGRVGSHDADLTEDQVVTWLKVASIML